jgi:hypothetical protein
MDVGIKKVANLFAVAFVYIELYQCRSIQISHPDAIVSHHPLQVLVTQIVVGPTNSMLQHRKH